MRLFLHPLPLHPSRAFSLASWWRYTSGAMYFRDLRGGGREERRGVRVWQQVAVARNNNSSRTLQRQKEQRPKNVARGAAWAG